MSARILDGQSVAAAIREAVLPDVHAFTAAAGRPPGLGIVLVGEDPGSEIYVRNKVRAGTESGLWVDGAVLDVKGGGTLRRGTIYGAPAAPLAPGPHVATAFARSARDATAVAWTFTVARS